MTIKEADEAALKRAPVICDGIRYERISRVGYFYLENGEKRPFVEMYDKNRNSTMWAIPKNVELADAPGGKGHT